MNFNVDEGDEDDDEEYLVKEKEGTNEGKKERKVDGGGDER